MTQAHQLHHQAEDSREAGQFTQAIQLFDQALEQYQKNHNFAQISEVYQGKFITYKHLYDQTHDSSYLDQALQAVETSLSLIKQHAQGNIATSYLQLGEYYLLLKKYDLATQNFELAWDNLHNPVEEGRYLYHWGEAIFLNGDKSEGQKLMLRGIKRLQEIKGQVNDFVHDVWLSGGYLALYKLLKSGQPQEAKKYRQLAAQIIDHNPKLLLRKKHLQDLN